MTVASETSSISYAGNGATTVFSIPFYFLANGDLDVYLTDSAGNISPQTLSTHYTLAGAGTPTGGTLTMLTAPASGSTVTIIRNPDVTQNVDYTANDAFPAETHETALDRLTMIAQRLAYQIARALRLPDGDTTAASSTLLSSSASRANKYLAFDSNGAPTVAASIGSTALTSALIAATANSMKQTAGEASASVVPTDGTYPPVNSVPLMRYGADPTGVSTSDAALTAAIAALGANGGTIEFGPGLFKFSSKLLLTGLRSIVLKGAGMTTAGSAPATTLQYTGTDTHFINLDNAYGIVIDGFSITYTNASFTGDLIRATNPGGLDPAYIVVKNCLIGASIGTGCTHLNLDKCIFFRAENCNFVYGNPSVSGQNAAGGSYSNVVSFSNCVWHSSRQYPIKCPGESWTFDACTFENMLSGQAGAINSNASALILSLKMSGCWFGDVTVAGGTWLTLFGRAISITGCRFGGEVTSTMAISLRNVQGAAINGNSFDTFFTAFGFDTAGGTGIDISGNRYTNVTNQIGSSANAPLNLVMNPSAPQAAPPAALGKFTTNGFEVSPNGIIRQWGTATVTTGTPLAVTFALAFPNALFALNVGLVTPSAGGNTSYATSPTTSGFSANVAGTAGSNTVHWQAVGN